MYKKIDGLQPFNDLLLQSCFYNQRTAAYSAFGIDPKIVAGNYLPLYKFYPKTGILKLDCREIFNKAEMQRLTGVKLNKYKIVDNFEKFVIGQINKNCPVMVFVDCFYLNYRKDTYKKMHSLHSILIYGYDDIKKIFVISEHMYLNSFKYTEQAVSIDIIKAANQSYMQRFMKGKNSLITFTRLKEPSMASAGELFLKKIAARKTDLRKSLDEFEKGMECLIACLSEQTKLESELDVIIKFLGEVRRNKNVQKNLLGYVFGENEMYTIADRIIEDYIFIYGLMVKMKITKRYDRNALEKAIVRCEEVLFLEKKLHGLLAEVKV